MKGEAEDCDLPCGRLYYYLLQIVVCPRGDLVLPTLNM
jgi:hypothetical protein